MMEENSIDQWLVDRFRNEILKEVKEELMSAEISIVSKYKATKIELKSNFGIWIKNSEEVQSLKNIDTKNKDEYVKIKSELPRYFLTTGAPVGGLISEMSEIVNCFGIIDIDHIECSDKLFEKLNKVPFVVGTSMSLSGEGYYSIFKFNKEKVKTFEDFSIMYEEIVEWYRDELDIQLDESLKTPKKSRTLSPYDFIWNKNYREDFDPVLNRKTKKENINNDDYSPSFEGKIFKEPYIKGQMYWKRYGWANTIFNTFGSDGYTLFMDIFSEDEDKINLESVWKTASKGGKESSKYCLNKLERAGYIKMKPKKIEYKDENNEFDSGEGMFSW